MGESNARLGYKLFVDQISRVVEKYPKLSRVEQNGQFLISGEIDIVDSTGKYWESYQIEIHCSALFPNRFPDLYETGGKIPKIGDWHVYEDTKTCCVKILPEELLRSGLGITLEQYVTEEVLPYLFNQTHRRVEGYYVNGEYGHGNYGIYQYYALNLKTDDLMQISKILYAIGTIAKPNRTSLCFCGSGLKYRYCHRAAFEKFCPLGRNILIEHAKQLYILAK